MVEVVHLKKCSPPWGQPGDVRIDRRTKWGNPYTLPKYNRDTACDLYEAWFEEQEKKGVFDISELKDAKRLGCWCKFPQKPLRCHGDYLKRRIEGL